MVYSIPRKVITTLSTLLRKVIITALSTLLRKVIITTLSTLLCKVITTLSTLLRKVIITPLSSDTEEEVDEYETIIERSGCAKEHYTLEDCYHDNNRKWAKCKDEMNSFRQCMAIQATKR